MQRVTVNGARRKGRNCKERFSDVFHSSNWSIMASLVLRATKGEISTMQGSTAVGSAWKVR
jgi:hypothetical protein